MDIATPYDIVLEAVMAGQPAVAVLPDVQKLLAADRKRLIETLLSFYAQGDCHDIQ
jgi:hypothetical protein